MQRAALIAVAAGLASAVLHLSTQLGPLGALFLAVFTPLPLLMTGLGLGLTPVLVAIAAGTLTIGAGVGLERGALYLVSDAAPAAVITRFALLNRTTEDGTTEWYPPGRILTWITLYAVGVFLLLSLWMSGRAGGIEEAVSGFVESFRSMWAGAPDAAPAVDRFVAVIERVFPFLAVGWWMVVVALNAGIAQRVLTRMGRNLRPAPDFGALALPRWMTPAVVAAAAVALVGSGWLGFMATNIALILFIPFFLVGLAVIHVISMRWPGRIAILFAIYFLMILFGWPVLLVAGLGVLEHWMGLRWRLAGPGQGNERDE